MIVLHVRLEMLGQVDDPLRKDGDLDFRRTGVIGPLGVLANQRLLAFGNKLETIGDWE